MMWFNLYIFFIYWNLLFNDVLSVDINEYEAVVGMGTGREIPDTRRKHEPMAACPPQIPQGMEPNMGSCDSA
jgi:hypothetical protein